MTINEAITIVDELKPNAYSTEDKIRWLNDINGRISVTVHNNKKYNPINNPDEMLLVQSPYENLYILYLIAMIDYNNEESGPYTNDIMLFNNALDEYKKWYLKNVSKNGRIKNYW